jgi:hypothetical protein
MIGAHGGKSQSIADHSTVNCGLWSKTSLDNLRARQAGTNQLEARAAHKTQTMQILQRIVIAEEIGFYVYPKALQDGRA